MVQWQAFEIGQRRVPSSEVVQREAHTNRTQFAHLDDGIVHLIEQQALGQLQLEPVRVGARDAQQRQQLVGELGLAKLPGADIHGHRQPLGGRLAAPRDQLPAGGFQYPVADRKNQAGVFGQWNELGWRNHTPHRVLPADQGLYARHFSCFVHHRLVIKQELLPRQTLAQIRLQTGPGGRRRLHDRVEKALRITSCRFGLVHRQVGALEQLIHRLQILKEQRDANAR